MKHIACALAMAISLSSLAIADVNPVSGNFSVEYVDCAFSRGLEFQLTRAYHSRSTFRGLFGHKWFSILDQRLEFSAGAIILTEYQQAVRNEFTLTSPDVYVSRLFPAQRITRENTWWVRKHSPVGDAAEYFDAQGRLIRILNKGQFVDIQYTSAGAIALVSDGLGQKMFFTTNPKGLVTLIKREDAKAASPTEECRYGYSPKDELTSARNELGNTYHYAYDRQGRHLLTQVSQGMSIPLIMTYFDPATPEGKLNLLQSRKDRDGNLRKFSYTLEDKRAWLKETVTIDKRGVTKTTRYENGTGREIEAQDEELLTAQEEKVLRQFLPALTLIHVHHKKLGKRSGGTGFFISPDGILLTNKHVVERAIRYPEHFLEITLPDEKVLKENWAGMTKAQLRPRLEANATIMRDVRFISCGTTYGRDLCLLKLNLYPKKHFSVDQELPKEGSELFTIGNPRLKGLLIDNGKFLERRNHSGVSEVSISIKTRPGNSGGPIFTATGHLLGILTAQYTSKLVPTDTEQVGISAFEVKSLLDKYIAQPRTYSLEEFQRVIPSDMVWYEKETKATPRPEKLSGTTAP